MYVFGIAWGLGGVSLLDKYYSDNVVFLKKYDDGDSDKVYSDKAEQIKKGDIIVLRTGNNIQHNLRLSYIGIANTDARVVKMYSTYPLYKEDTKKLLPDTNKDTYAVYVTIDKWYNIPNDNSDSIVSGMADRIVCLNSGSNAYGNAYDKTIKFYNEIIIKDENKMKNEIYELLKNNYNLILTGAPGTGKTYLAKQIAAKIIFGEEKNINEMNDDEKAKFEYQYKFVQFHPSYDYTDFVEGIRPVTKENNNYGFERKDGTFKEFCKRAVYINIEYHKLVISKLKEFCEYLLQETQNHTVDIENVKGIKGAPAPIKTVIYNKENETVKIIVDTKSGNNGISPTSLHKIVDWYQLYTTQFLELDKEQQNMKIFDNILGITYGGSHTYVYGFIKLFHDKYKDALQIPINYQVEKDDKTPFIFVIDEINRGDINKILGELFYAIDLGYRGEKGKVETQYQNLVKADDVFVNGFYIPENVYIIGTMNDIDRSVESMDFAIRRRFAWQEVKPEDTADEILKDLEIDKNVANLNQKAVEILKKINNCIAGKDKEESTNNILGEMYQIGASYFLKLDTYFKAAVNKNEDKEICIKEAYQKLWDNHLKGLICEYVRGKRNSNEIFDKIQKKYFDLTGINCKENNEDTAE